MPDGRIVLAMDLEAASTVGFGSGAAIPPPATGTTAIFHTRQPALWHNALVVRHKVTSSFPRREWLDDNPCVGQFEAVMAFGGTGNDIKNVQPSPISDSIQIFPPACSTIFLQTAKPIPEPS